MLNEHHRKRFAHQQGLRSEIHLSVFPHTVLRDQSAIGSDPVTADAGHYAESDPDHHFVASVRFADAVFPQLRDRFDLGNFNGIFPRHPISVEHLRDAFELSFPDLLPGKHYPRKFPAYLQNESVVSSDLLYQKDPDDRRRNLRPLPTGLCHLYFGLRDSVLPRTLDL